MSVPVVRSLFLVPRGDGNVIRSVNVIYHVATGACRAAHDSRFMLHEQTLEADSG